MSKQRNKDPGFFGSIGNYIADRVIAPVIRSTLDPSFESKVEESKYSKYNTRSKSADKRKTSQITDYYRGRRRFQRVNPPSNSNSNSMPRNVRRSSTNRPSINRSFRLRKRNTRFGKRSRRYGRRYRVRGRFRGRRKRYGRSSKGKFRKAIISAITPTDTLSYQIGDVFLTPTSDSTAGIRCRYWSISSDDFVNDPFGPTDPDVLRNIAYKIVTRLGLSPPYDISFQVQKASILSRLTNCSNFAMDIVGYKCKARRDLPNVAPFTSGDNSVKEIIGRGFSDAGIDALNRGAGNTGLLQSNLSPYDSPMFTQTFKIVKRTKVHLRPGKTAKFGVFLKKPFTVRVNKWLDLALNTTTYDTATLTVNWCRGESFWLWKCTPSQIGNNNTIGTAVAAAEGRINCITTVNFDYKYINNLLPNIANGTNKNISTAGTVNIMPDQISYTNQINAGHTT